MVNLIIIATINPNEKEALSHYLENVGKLYAEVQAKPVGKYKISETTIGNRTPSLVSIMEFTNKESHDKVFESEEYQKLIPYRDKAFSSLDAFLS